MNKPHIFKEKSLKWQLLRRMFLLLVCFLVILEIFQYFFLKQYLIRTREQLLESRISNVCHIVDTTNSESTLKKNLFFILKNSIYFNTSASVIDKDGNTLLAFTNNKNSIPDTPPSKISPDGPKLSSHEYKLILKRQGNLDGYSLIKNKHGDLQITIWRKIGKLNSPSGLIQLSTPFSSVSPLLYKQLYIYILACTLILILSIIIGGSLIKHTLTPLFNITDTLKDITIGDLNKRLPENNNQIEINQLSNAFNTMFSGIESSFNREKQLKKQMQQFVSDASHELRTPLTSIRGFVEVLLMGSYKDEEKLKFALNTILTENNRLTELVNNLLTLTRLDKGIYTEMVKQNMKNIIEEIYPQLKILASNRQLILNIHDNNTYFLGNKNQIKQVIFNIVQNSINYTDPENGIITISLYTENNFLVLKLSDNGVGISEEDLAHIFDRFFRSEVHRSRASGGCGLGLSIAKSIIEGHSGEISAKSTLRHGTSFYIKLKML
ncbi:sensor histidine kinase [Clostridium felsineum]|uniref:sensor histidine kinase n=1 Tax=Clostridium felsineum TaxID=36839 RepID=UPI00098C6DE5|nr:HAMP domain-containing sensor histidine kinase [Clostridium felsineum]URZ15178.1 Sensor histidine kinase RcsC [Clostridium felsineum DSM 794]